MRVKVTVFQFSEISAKLHFITDIEMELISPTPKIKFRYRTMIQKVSGYFRFSSKLFQLFLQKIRIVDIYPARVRSFIQITK